MINETDTSTALAKPSDKRITKIGDKDSHLVKVGRRIVSKRGYHVPALIEYLDQPKWRKRSRAYDPDVEKNKDLCSVEELARVLDGRADKRATKKVRTWLSRACRIAMEKGYFIVMNQYSGAGHHGETFEVILCPSNPSPALRSLALIQIAKRVKRGDMSAQQARLMRAYIGCV